MCKIVALAKRLACEQYIKEIIPCFSVQIGKPNENHSQLERKSKHNKFCLE